MFKKIDSPSADAEFSLFLWTFQDLTALFDIQVLLSNNQAGLLLMQNRAWLFLKTKHKKTSEISFACNQHLFPTNAMPSQPEEKWLLKAGVLSNYSWFEQVINTYVYPGLQQFNLVCLSADIWLGTASFRLVLKTGV